MNLAQSSHVPEEGKRPGFSDLGWLARYALRGFIELVRARFIFRRLQTKDILQRNNSARLSANSEVLIEERSLARIAYVLPRLSDRLPWRSDCLIQAIAGQNWLKSLKASSEIQIGVENPKDGDFGAHAWLIHDDTIVTGGDIARYHLLLGDSGNASGSKPNGAQSEPG